MLVWIRYLLNAQSSFAPNWDVYVGRADSYKKSTKNQAQKTTDDNFLCHLCIILIYVLFLTLSEPFSPLLSMPQEAQSSHASISLNFVGSSFPWIDNFFLFLSALTTGWRLNVSEATAKGGKVQILFCIATWGASYAGVRRVKRIGQVSHYFRRKTLFIAAGIIPRDKRVNSLYLSLTSLCHGAALTSFLSLFLFLSVACIARLYDEAEVDDALVKRDE